MGGVAEQRDPAERPPRQGVAVDHRVLPHPIGGDDECRHVEPVEAEGVELSGRFGRIGEVFPVLGRHRSFVGDGDLDDPVDECATSVLVELGDRVGDEAAAEVAGEDHRATRQQRRPLGGAAPHRDAVPAGRALCRVQTASDHRMDAVAPDEDVAGDEPGRTVRADEAGPHAARGRVEPHEVLVGAHGVGAEPRHHGTMQHPEQFAAVDRQLRPAIAGGESARLAPDALAVLGVVHDLGGGDGEREQFVEQSELGQLAHGVRQEVDADPELADRRRALVDLDLGDPGGVERQRERHATNAAPRDDDRDVVRPMRAGGGHGSTIAAAAVGWLSST